MSTPLRTTRRSTPTSSSDEAGPGPVPAIAITGSDLLGDGQALAHVSHARMGLADTALELAVEILVIEIQLHYVSPWGT